MDGARVEGFGGLEGQMGEEVGVETRTCWWQGMLSEWLENVRSAGTRAERHVGLT